MQTMNKVKMFRVGANLTQDEMAKVIGVSLVSYRLKETGEREFKLNEMNAFLSKIKETSPNVTLDDIFLN